MANNLPSVHRWFAEDYKNAPEWFTRFLSSLNLFSDPIYSLLNGGVSVTLNTAEEIYTLQVNPASATATSNTFTFTPKKFVGKPNGVIIGQALLNTTTGVATANANPVTLDWVWTGSQINILAIHGLTASASYTFNLRIY